MKSDIDIDGYDEAERQWCYQLTCHQASSAGSRLAIAIPNWMNLRVDSKCN